MYADDVAAGVAFYAAFGFEESYRYAPAGEPLHVEVRNGGLTIGIASVRAARDDDGLEVSQEAAAMEIVLWCDTTWSGVETLDLVVTAGGNAWDHADWADARLNCDA